MTAPALHLLLAVLAASSAEPGVVERMGPPPPASVRRIVTLAPSLTDVVMELGATDRLVGVSRFDGDARVQTLPRVGGYTDPSVETVVALKPDLVLVQPSPGNHQPVLRMAELGLPIFAVRMRTVKDVLESIRAIGTVLGRPEQAAAEIARLEKTRERIRRAAKERSKRKVLVIYGFQPLVVAGPGSFAHELLSDVGAENAAASARAPYPSYSAESLIRLGAQVVIDASNTRAGEAAIRSLPTMAETPWKRVKSEALMQPGPGLGTALLELYELVHGSLP